MQITGISFDGMHRSGKGSQIKLLREYLHNKGIHNIGVRGEYYRKGSGENQLEDPYSLWRQQNIYNDNYEEKSNKLNRELFILYQKKYKEFLEKMHINKGFIIQDRSIVGNYLFQNTVSGNKNTNIETFYTNKSKSLIHKVIIPNIMFILQPSKDLLLKRLHDNYNPQDDNAEQRLLYKQKYIEEYYELYYNGYNTIPSHIKNQTIVIESDGNKHDIHKKIITHLSEKIGDIFERDNNCINT